jgi:transposase
MPCKVCGTKVGPQESDVCDLCATKAYLLLAQERIAELEALDEDASQWAQRLAPCPECARLRARMQRIANEIDCRIEHGANSNGHLEGILGLLKGGA